MSNTNPTFDEKELKLLLTTLVKVRSLMFDATEIQFDPLSAKDPDGNIPLWRGTRGTCPLLDDIERTLALVRLHINKEETIELYTLMGFFDKPVVSKDS